MSVIERIRMDGTVKQRQIEALQAQVNANANDGAGSLLNLDDLVVGATVNFTTTKTGEVFSLCEPTMGSNDHVVSVRAFIRHDGGAESYHTYRFDGRSHHCPSHDIVSITPPLK